MKPMILSWLTTIAGLVAGGPAILAGFAGLLDEDPATGIVWNLVIAGVGALLVGFFAKDGNKKSADVGLG